MADTLSWVVGSILKIPFDISAQLLVWAGKFLNWTFSQETFKGIPAVDAIWKLFRDICNMFFIVILMVSAIATILQIKKYEIGSILKQLVIVIFVINFSKTIIYVIVDFTQVLAKTFFQVVGAGTQLSEQLGNSMGITGIYRGVSFFSQDAYKGGVGWTVVGHLLMSTVVQTIAAVTLGVGAILLLERMIYIWISIASAPIVWGLSAIPGMGGQLKSWWGTLFKKAFFAPIYAAYLAFALLLIRGSGYFINSAMITPGEGLTDFFRSPGYIINYIVSIIVLWSALKYAKKSGGIATGYVAGKGMDFLNWGKEKITPPVPFGRTAAAVMAEHKARVEMKDKMKQETAQNWAQKGYKAKDIVHSPLEKAGTWARGVARDSGFPGAANIDEKGKMANILDKRGYQAREKMEINKLRLETAKEFKDTPPDMEDIVAKLITNANTKLGEKQALAQYLKENTFKFSSDYATANKEFKVAAEALEKISAEEKIGFIAKVGKSRIDLVAQFKSDTSPTTAKTTYEEEMDKALTGMDAKTIIDQAGPVYKNNTFIDSVKKVLRDPKSGTKLYAGIARLGTQEKLNKLF